MTKASQSIACAVFLGLYVRQLPTREDSPQLTLQEAHEAALRNHPLISVADLKALAARQVTRQFQSGFFPTLSANVVAVGTANDNTRLAAIGALNNPSIFDRNAEGLILSQLITDFGRTANLTGSAKLRAEAEAEQRPGDPRANPAGGRWGLLRGSAGPIGHPRRRTDRRRPADVSGPGQRAGQQQASLRARCQFRPGQRRGGKLLLSKAQNDLQAALPSSPT